MNENRAAPTLLHVFSTFEVGGPQVRFAALVNHFGAEFRHLVFAMDGVYAAKSRISPTVGIDCPEIAVSKGKTFANICRFRAALRRLKPDALVTYNWGAIEWAMANWPGIVRHIHIADGFGPEEAHGQLPRRAFARRVVLASSTVAFPSRTIEKIAVDVWKLSPRRLRLIPNGIDCARFAVPRSGTSLWSARGPVIGTVAALRREKNLGRLLEAFARVRAQTPCQLVIAGDGPERAILEAETDRLGLRKDVSFTGYISETEQVYAGLDIFALSSETEQMPTSVLEAMAAGLPIAATDVGDVRAMVSEENQPFVTPLGADELASAITRLISDPPLCRRVGAANEAVARRVFDQSGMFQAYRVLFRGE